MTEGNCNTQVYKEYLRLLVLKLESKGCAIKNKPLEIKQNVCVLVIRKKNDNPLWLRYYFGRFLRNYDFGLTLHFDTNDDGETEIVSMVTKNDNSFYQKEFHKDQEKMQIIKDVVDEHSQSFFKKTKH